MLDFHEECLDFEAEDYELENTSASTTLNNKGSMSNNREDVDINLNSNKNTDNAKLLRYPPQLKHLKYPTKYSSLNGIRKDFPPFRNRPQFLKDIDSGNFSDLSNGAPCESTSINARKNRLQDCDSFSPDDDTASGSDLAISTDDENRLLEESEDEYYEEEEEPEIKPSSFFANKRIIFGDKAVCISSSQQTVPKRDGKRKGSPNEKSKDIFVSRNVSKKWDAAYVADNNPDKIFLRDIGYIPLEVEPIESCRSSASSNQSQPDSIYEPSLPPVKRPPTRQTRFSDENATQNQAIPTDKNRNVAAKQDSAIIKLSDISTNGSSASIHSRENISKQNRSPSPQPTFKLPTNKLPSTRSGPKTSSSEQECLAQKKSHHQPESYQDTSLNSSREDDGLSLVAPSLASVTLNWNKIEEPMMTETWMETKHNDDIDDEEWESISTIWAKNQDSNHISHNDETINFSDVPTLFGGLCYHHFFFGNCNNKTRCNMMHFVRPSLIQKRCTKSTKEMVLKAYKFTLRMPNLYKETHLCFIAAFAHFKMRREIVLCIGDFLKFEKLISIFGAVEETIKGLIETGLTFLESIQLLILNYGLMNHPLLVDILLEMLTEKPYLNDEHWKMIKTYCLAKGNISAEIAERIIISCIRNQCDPKLYSDILNVIIESEIVDLSSIDQELLTQFKMLPNKLTKYDPPESSSLMTIPNVPILPLPPANLPQQQQQQITAQFLMPPPLPPIRRQLSKLPNLSEPPPKIAPPAKLNFEPPASLRFERRPPSPPHAPSPLMQLILRPPPPPPPLVDARPINNKIPIGRINAQLQEKKVQSAPLEPEIYVSNSQSDIQIQNEMTLFPKKPVVGKRKNNSNYIRKHFLHHLLPISKQSTDLHEGDVKRLDQAVMNGDGMVFFQLMEEYSKPPTVESFTTLVIAQLKSVSNPMNVFNRLMNSLAKIKPDFDKLPFVKGIIEVLVMNLLLELNKRNMPKLASDLLCRFLDWDSLTTSKIFCKGLISEMGIYLFFAKMLTIGERYIYVIDIIGCPTLHLLEPRSTWPYLSVERDMCTRNKILDRVMTETHKQCFKKALDLFIQTLPTGIFNYDVRKYFNDMMKVLLDRQKLTPLKMILDHIDIFYKYMDENILRAFYIIMYSHINGLELKLSIYELCCERGIYTLYKGTETNIALRADMSREELEYILCYFFKKMCRLSVPPRNDLKIELNPSKYPTNITPPIILSQNIPRHYGEMCEAVQSLLKDHYHLDMEVDVTRTSLTIRQQKLFQWWNHERNNTLF